MVRTGLENFLESPPDWINGKAVTGRRIGLLCNPASVDRKLNHADKLIAERFPGQLTALFSPQHGFFAEKQDNMIESDHKVDPVLNIPIFSLYGETRSPTAEMLDMIDVILIDLQDVGTRVYTFIYTMSYCMEGARQFGKKVVVLDRPNPINGIDVEGDLLSEECVSFVGRFPLPMRHGLTIGELARLLNIYFGIGCDLTVIPLTGWRRSMYFSDTGLIWVLPSPNMPSPETALVYPGQVIWEGTNISEGRGTTLPFQIFGAPFINQSKVLAAFGESTSRGIILRTCSFEPVHNKWQGQTCYGFQLHVINRDIYRPYQTSLDLAAAVFACHSEDFQWKKPPYEYEYIKPPIDLITGTPDVRQAVEQGQLPLGVQHERDLQEYQRVCQSIYLY